MAQRSLLGRYRAWSAANPWALPLAIFLVPTLGIGLFVPGADVGAIALVAGFAALFVAVGRFILRDTYVTATRRPGEGRPGAGG